MTNEELVQLYQAGDKQALDNLIEQNAGIVYKIANNYYVDGSSSIDKEDLQQEGFIGLMKAAVKYDINNPRKAKFITYAVFWIIQCVNSFINKKNTNKETSLNVPKGEDDDRELVDYIKDVDYGYENVEEKIYIKQLHEELSQVMNNTITLQERQTVELRHGFCGAKSMTLDEIGTIFNFTKDRVRNIENRAYRKMLHSSWGKNKFKEIYSQKKYEAFYSIPAMFDKFNFEDKFLTEMGKGTKYHEDRIKQIYGKVI